MTMPNRDHNKQHGSPDPDARPEDQPQAGDEGQSADESRGADQPRNDESAQDEAVEQFQEAESAMEALQRERDELFTRLQRVSADYQNYMKRAEQNLANAVDHAKADALKNLIPVLDQFDRALEAEPGSEEAKGLYEGMRIVREEMLKSLEQAGVRRIDPEPGDRFDPHIHEAMMRQPAEGIDPNHVAQPFAPGYVYKSRTLRPAKVAVVPEPEDGGEAEQG